MAIKTFAWQPGKKGWMIFYFGTYLQFIIIIIINSSSSSSSIIDFIW